MARKKKQQEPKIGHNGGPPTADRKKQLEGYISEVERWEDQKKIIVDDIALIYTAAKDAGFDTKAMRLIVKDRNTVAFVDKKGGRVALGARPSAPTSPQVDLEEAIAAKEPAAA